MARDDSMIGQSAAFLDAVERVSRAAALNRPVLVIGERGTGKELVAERLHRLSQRWSGPLVTMNCAALPETLIEAELFGHEAGAFTGATKARQGRFEEADGGTLFLDEIGTLSMAAQERLLRATEYGEVTRIGSNRPLHVDVRIVGATNENLPGMVEQDKFRADLLDRLSFEVVTLPPLRAREDDVPVLAELFGRKMASELGWTHWAGFSPRAMATLEAYPWPGNVRELRNVVERAIYRWDDPERPVDEVVFDPFASAWAPPSRGGGSVMPQAAPAPVAKTAPVTHGHDPVAVSDMRSATEAFERAVLEAALVRCRHNQRVTAKALSLTYDQLRHSLRRHKMLGDASTAGESLPG